MGSIPVSLVIRVGFQFGVIILFKRLMRLLTSLTAVSTAINAFINVFLAIFFLNLFTAFFAFFFIKTSFFAVVSVYFFILTWEFIVYNYSFFNENFKNYVFFLPKIYSVFYTVNGSFFFQSPKVIFYFYHFFYSLACRFFNIEFGLALIRWNAKSSRNPFIFFKKKFRWVC